MTISISFFFSTCRPAAALLEVMNCEPVLFLVAFSIVSHGKKVCLQCRRPRFNLWVKKIPLEKRMTIYSSILAWRVPWTEQPGRLQSVGLQRVEHD